MWTRLVLAVALIAFLAAAIATGCGGPDFVVGSATAPPSVTAASGSPTVACGPAGAICTSSSDCCSGVCGFFGQCQ